MNTIQYRLARIVAHAKSRAANLFPWTVWFVGHRDVVGASIQVNQSYLTNIQSKYRRFGSKCKGISVNLNNILSRRLFGELGRVQVASEMYRHPYILKQGHA